MKKHAFLIFALVLFVFALIVVNTYHPEDATAKLSGGSSEGSSTSQGDSNTDSVVGNDTTNYGKAPDFTLVDMEGNKVSLSDYKGKKVFVNFWATWCPPCKAEMPELEKVYQETKDSDLVILAIEIGEPEDTVKSFIDEKGYNFKVLLDLDQNTATDYGISAIPASFFIDENGNIVAKKVGGMTQEEMEDNIALLNQ